MRQAGGSLGGGSRPGISPLESASTGESRTGRWVGRWPVGLAILLLAGLSARSQVITNRPAQWKANSHIMGASMDIGRVELPYNSPTAVRGEILDPSLLQTIATANDLATQDIAGLRLFQDPRSTVVELYRLDGNLRAFNVVHDRLLTYVEGRKEGHTREYMVAAMTNKSILHFSQPDADLRYLLIAYPTIPEAFVKKYASGTRTNRVGRTSGRPTIDDPPPTNVVSRWTAYSVMDGLIAWGYYLYFNPDDTLDGIEEVKCDARELDPKFAPVLKEVDAQVEAQMKQEKTYGRLGSLHTFWRLRKQRLKERGIDWRSPGELNPHIRYE